MALWLPRGGVLHLGMHGGGARWTSRCSHLGTITPEKLPDGRPGYRWRELPSFQAHDRLVELGVLGDTRTPLRPICGDCWRRLASDLQAVEAHQLQVDHARA